MPPTVKLFLSNCLCDIDKTKRNRLDSLKAVMKEKRQ